MQSLYSKVSIERWQTMIQMMPTKYRYFIPILPILQLVIFTLVFPIINAYGWTLPNQQLPYSSSCNCCCCICCCYKQAQPLDLSSSLSSSSSSRPCEVYRIIMVMDLLQQLEEPPRSSWRRNVEQSLFQQFYPSAIPQRGTWSDARPGLHRAIFRFQSQWRLEF